MAILPGTKFKTVDEYFAAAPEESLTRLKEIRSIILKNAPGAEEVISYNMPAVKLDGTVAVYYAGYKKHIGFYPTPGPIKIFAKELEAYEQSKGAIQFALDKPLPATLIGKIVKLRLKTNKEAALAKKAHIPGVAARVKKGAAKKPK